MRATREAVVRREIRRAVRPWFIAGQTAAVVTG